MNDPFEAARDGVASAEVETVEVAIVGGGLVGLTLAIALAEQGIEVAVVDQEDPAAQRQMPYDGRSTAIALGTRRVLETTGVWASIASQAQPIDDIRVSDGPSRLFLHYDHRDVATAEGAEPFGHIVENRVIREALHARAAKLGSLRWLAPMRLGPLPGAIERSAGGVRLALANGRIVESTLLIGADGAESAVRADAGIGTVQHDYGQSAIVCTVTHERPHENVAHERFLPAGPFALLPMTPGPDHPHRSSLVWTERRGAVPALMALDDSAFGMEMERRFGPFLGKLRPEGGRWTYPLVMVLAERLTAPRLALVGDAAHRIHPLAGQGLNLGIRDLAALAEAIVDARRIGLDLGSQPVLDRYARWRRFDTLLMAGAMHGLNRLFSNDVLPLRLARDLGIAAVDRMGPLKRLFMRHAMGTVGQLPRLIRGAAL
ncbi:MAG: UbiH/UbiF/VisC/COQ6 family ubiquinone biosynthesis hydroxylase [Alphaproteobacteria bacterium]|nr:UbiH/UbiF/VisC/COQ6 family ubiquinone biosynthesis hydroxylase [Alphaproteobacteria bacterium]